MKAKELSARVFLFVRETRKISQQQLAIKLRVNQSTISKIEKGLHFPSTMVLRRLEQYMDSTMNELIKLSHNKKEYMFNLK